jgi:L-malate glycosyltransferase
MTSPRSSLRVGVACFSSFGGSGVVASEIGMALGRRGHQMHFLSDRSPDRLDLASPNVSFHQVALLDYPVLAQSSYALALASKMIEVARREKLDLFHLHYAFPHAASALLARQVLGGSAPRILTTLHGTDVTQLGADPGFLPLIQFSVLASDGLTAPSHWLAEAAHQQLAIPRGVAIEVIPNFVDTRKFCPPDSARTPASPRVLTHISNFRPLKRVDDVVQIFARVRATLPVYLQLLGDGPERPRIAALVTSLGLADHVRFLGEGNPVEALQGSDVFLLPSDTESFGLAALEAMACGVPVVASDVGGLPEVVIHGESGFLAPVGDIDAMAEHVRSLLTDDPLHRRMSQAARHRTENHYQVEPAALRYEQAYRRILLS